MEAIDHLDLVVSDLDRSLAFYRGLLRPLGYVRETPIEGERGEHVVYFGRVGGFGSISLRASQTPSQQPYDRYAVGIHHIALSCSSRTALDERAAWLADQPGVAILSGPREFHYTPGYYAVFFTDPDAIKLELIHRPSERDLARRVAELEERLARLEP